MEEGNITSLLDGRRHRTDQQFGQSLSSVVGVGGHSTDLGEAR
jgi:hypothetical protein